MIAERLLLLQRNTNTRKLSYRQKKIPYDGEVYKLCRFVTVTGVGMCSKMSLDQIQTRDKGKET